MCDADTPLSALTHVSLMVSGCRAEENIAANGKQDCHWCDRCIVAVALFAHRAPSTVVHLASACTLHLHLGGPHRFCGCAPRILAPPCAHLFAHNSSASSLVVLAMLLYAEAFRSCFWVELQCSCLVVGSFLCSDATAAFAPFLRKQIHLETLLTVLSQVRTRGN